MIDAQTAVRIARLLHLEPQTDHLQAISHTDDSAGSARELWNLLANQAGAHHEIDQLLGMLLQSVLIDLATYQMTHSDEYALVIGQRMAALLTAASSAPEHSRGHKR